MKHEGMPQHESGGVLGQWVGTLSTIFVTNNFKVQPLEKSPLILNPEHQNLNHKLQYLAEVHEHHEPRKDWRRG